ncbi:mannose-1-phosphate guanylyltransferase [Mesonia sp.]|uniref:mannose-1-phosphate guanylyltransferase n=1 Tax=Mesonia sp. TaxID=1960830 RepID=UPI003F9870EE
MEHKNYYAVLMAGGVGSRFWPLSKKAYPKQFHDMLGTGETLIQKTFSRLEQLIPAENIYILTNELYEDLVKEQLPKVEDRQIVLEPSMNNTAPCILLSSLKIQKENPEALMIVAPSDHWIEDEAAFIENVQASFDACQRDRELLMTLGIEPSFPHTGYGYIQYEEQDQTAIKKVINFTEKPDYATAKTFLKEGNYVWNAGIFIWSAKAILSAFETHLPEMYSLFSAGMKDYNTESEKAFIEKNYSKSENISIDYGIMEKSEKVSVLPANFDWNDLGSWGSLYDKLEKDEKDNVVVNARSYMENASGNIVRTTKGKTVVLKDLNEYIVVENEEVLLICPKSDEQEIKSLRNSVKEKFGEELI